MDQRITTVGFDADDTLWHNEQFFQLTQTHFAHLLADYTEKELLIARLQDAERRNLGHYGFGIKGFTLSMIETAIEVTDGKVPASVISELLATGRDMLRHPVDLLPHAERAVECARQQHRVVLITKGDLLDQERKLAQSGLGDLFDGIEIVSDKTPAVYQRIFKQHGNGAEQGVMIGNSMRSDVLPMIAAGGWGVHVPDGFDWEIERALPPEDTNRFRAIKDLSHLPELLLDLREEHE